MVEQGSRLRQDGSLRTGTDFRGALIDNVTHARPATNGSWKGVAAFILPAAFLMHFDKHVFVVLSPMIRAEFQLGIVDVTAILSATSWCYAAFQLPGAWVARRFGPRPTMGVCLLLWSTVMLVTPLAAAPAAFVLLRGVLGALQAPDWSSSMMILMERSEGRRSRARVTNDDGEPGLTGFGKGQ